MFYIKSFLALVGLSFFSLSSSPIDLQQRPIQQRRIFDTRLFSPEALRFFARVIPAVTVAGLIYTAYWLHLEIHQWFWFTLKALLQYSLVLYL